MLSRRPRKISRLPRGEDCARPHADAGQYGVQQYGQAKGIELQAVREVAGQAPVEGPAALGQTMAHLAQRDKCHEQTRDGKFEPILASIDMHHEFVNSGAEQRLSMSIK